MKYLGNVSDIFGLIAFIAIILIATLAIKKASGKRNTEQDKKYKYLKKETVLSANENEWYWQLVEALPRNVILAQVNMSSCINTLNHQASFGTISQKSIDFLICSRDMKIIAAIEIDDKSHNMSSAKKRDETKNNALEAAGIRLIRWKATPVATKNEIIKSFADVVLGRQT